ncbi:MAG: MBL fold metallo-hydrolase [Chloroflexi bacterium]|jgi:ribonuclease Z|nr:MBL fold metallo-hydrolase [Chloroflexota bacterium]
MNSSSPYVVPLGIAAALPEGDAANSYLAVVREGRYWLIDCADSPIPRLRRAGLDPLAVQGVIITHFHPDHVYGLPAFLLGLFLIRAYQDQLPAPPLPIYARPEVMTQVRAMVALFESQGWLDEMPIIYHTVPAEVGATVATDDDFRITAAPTCHSAPSLAVRFERRDTGAAFVYSGDTAPCPAMTTLARDAALLFHEATGESVTHTTAAEAGALAAEVGAERLVLIHYHNNAETMQQLVPEAQRAFDGPVARAKELQSYAW